MAGRLFEPGSTHLFFRLVRLTLKHREFNKLKEGSIYLIYMGVIVTMILYQTNNASS